VPERVEAWWSRRQWSKGRDIPYRIGRFRSDWERYPALIRQYHPDLNNGVTLTQIPPAADVYLVWECAAGHRFVATPEEQRNRPGGARRKSTWCPDCTALAVTRPAPKHARPQPIAQEVAAPAPRKKLPKRVRPNEHSVGEAFASERAPKPASAAEADLRQRLKQRLELDFGCSAVRVARPFFTHLEVWPDIILPELRVAMEYDTTGREGLEHVGKKEQSDRRKDQLLREAGWEVIRIRCGKLLPIGPHDIVASGVTNRLVDRILDELRAVRGDLIVNCYLVDLAG
jgi:very-short-patch-repair endonuclease